MIKALFFLSVVFGSFLFSNANQSQPIQFFVIVPSYNNAQWAKANLDSVVAQTYPHWHIMYLNDCSADKTAKIVSSYISKHHLEDKITFVNNSIRLGSLANIYYAIKKVPPDAIVAIIDGDDRLIDNQAFEYLASQYEADPSLWLTYGNYVPYPNDRKPICAAIPDSIASQNKIRSYRFVSSHLRTFYAGLFHLIKKEDLLDNYGKFFMTAGDVAIMFPMLEMASQGHFRFIDKPFYEYNRTNPINDFRHKRLVTLAHRVIKARPCYPPLEIAPWQH